MTAAQVKVATVETIHQYLVDYFQSSGDPISPPGTRDKGLLESAVARPFQSAGGQDVYTDIFEKAAALFHSIINNHPFHNGNKRTALIAASVQLDEFGFWLEGCTDDELFDFTTQVAAHTITKDRRDEIEYIAEWFRANSRRRMKNEKPLKYGELKRILNNFGYQIDLPKSELLRITKGDEVITKVIKQGIQGFRPYHTHYIAELRKRLKLTPEYGVDSDRFYQSKNIDDSISEIVEIRNTVIRKLAKT